MKLLTTKHLTGFRSYWLQERLGRLPEFFRILLSAAQRVLSLLLSSVGSSIGGRESGAVDVRGSRTGDWARDKLPQRACGECRPHVVVEEGVKRMHSAGERSGESWRDRGNTDQFRKSPPQII